MTNAGKAFRGHAVGEVIRVLINKQVYSCKIEEIDNLEVSLNSVKEFEEFKNRLSNLLVDHTYPIPVKDIVNPTLVQKVNENILTYKECKDTRPLNNELNRILAFLVDKRLSDMEESIEVAVDVYSDSRENYVALLK